MKRFVFIFITLILFTSCRYNPPMFSIAVSIDLNENVTSFRTINDAWLEVRNTDKITGKYFLIPLSEKKIKINTIYSTNTDVLEITDVDTDSYTFSATIKNKGNAKIRIESDNYPTSTSLRIEIINQVTHQGLDSQIPLL